jgi:aminoglycoside/choline kinase family phosphotransferase
MIDYQDALWGDPAYDVASLLEDARRDVADTTVADCFARYVTAIGEDVHAFAARYSVIAAQRNAKIIGIFARLCVRDGKAHYLDYLPRVWGHFTNDISHPLLAPLKVFVDTHVPTEWRGVFNANLDIGGITP